ncbi:outer membrane receptor protein involved in Fe transport [Novosphingobium sp. SG751A]|uniref:TonB-dependent receptor n=1 Tax=Novosphingobium sp. SG751A TaxID=2587000 RepID=UPI00155829F4|nr:TonB-dependent receptor [Novosphingobium sp. SG751A]NOW47996.1 outer membrane receptor protein involved in Fe transport [Novosphingobium sp. SG751A]
MASVAIYAQPATATAQTRNFDLPAQSVRTGLPLFARQAGLQIIFPLDDASAGRIQSLHGAYDVRQALKTVLTGTGLSVISDNGHTVVLRKSGEASHARTTPVAMTQAIGLPVAPIEGGARQPEPPVQEIIVTGSNIKRADSGALPLSVVDRSAIETRNASTPVALLTSLPQVTGAPLNEGANGSFSARGDFAAINLRGIGSGNTLVLLDGRRLAPHAISTTDEGGLPSSSVNVNQLPTQGLDHIELLRDGASSIYGSDAVAGVINYIIDKKFNGLEARIRSTANEYGDGKEFSGSLLAGMKFAQGRGHVTATVDFYHRDAIFLKDRPYTAAGNFVSQAPAPWNAVSTLIPLSANPFYRLQAAGAYPSFIVGSGSTTNYVVPQSSSYSLTTTAPARSIDTAPGYYFNNNAYQAIVPQSDRINLFAAVDYELSPAITAFAELSYYRAHSVLVRQPISYNGGSFADQKLIVPAGSPFNPYGQPVTLLTKVFTDLPNERDEITDTVYRVLGGLRGTLADKWRWEAAAYYTASEVTDIGHNAVRESLLQKAVSDGTYNPFGFTFKQVGGAVVVDQPYSNPASAYSPFLADFKRQGRSSLASVDAKISGKLIDLWAGPLSVAAGGEFRRETFSFTMPPYAGLNPAGSGLATDNNDFILFGPAANWAASRNISSLYGEAVLPVISPDNKVPLIRSLELTGSFRFENYSDFGSVVKPKFGATLRPTRWLLFRGSYNQGFRAPNLPTLNGGERKSLSVFLDPMTNVSGPRWTIFAGNSTLKPEESTGRSLGAVVDVPFVRGLRFSVDYWEISQRNLITTVAVSDILQNDAALLSKIVAANPGIAYGAQPFGSGTDAYKGDPRVIRNADNTVYGVRTPPYNSASSFISGLDFSVTYRLPELPVGRFMLQFDAANLRRYEVTPTTGSLPDVRLGRDGASKWRGNLNLTWLKGGFSASLGAYYIGSYQSSSVTLPVATAAQQAQSEALYQQLGAPSYIAKGTNLGTVYYRYVVPATTTYNLSVGYEFRDRRDVLNGLGVRLGVVNLLDQHPPLDGTPQGYNTGVYGQLLPGRTWTLDISKKF